MKFPFYFCTNSFSVEKISVIGDFNNWDSSRNTLKKYDDDIWMTEVELSPGNYRYKFLINDNIYFNDPNARIYTNDDKGGTASAIIIAQSNKRMFNLKSASLNIESYSFLGFDKELLSCEVKERIYYKDKHSSVVLKIDFSDIKGLCTVNAIWYTPDNEIYTVQENVLEDCVKDGNAANEALFQIDIKDDLPEGDWRLQIFINGTFTLEDSITIELKQPEVVNEVESDGDAFIPLTDSELPDFLVDQDLKDSFTASEIEIKADKKTNEDKKEQLSGEELLDLFDDIKEMDVADTKEPSSPDEAEELGNSNIINLFDEILESGLDAENRADSSNDPDKASGKIDEADSGIDELLELKDFINSSQSFDSKPKAEEPDTSKSNEASIDEIFKDIKGMNEEAD